MGVARGYGIADAIEIESGTGIVLRKRDALRFYQCSVIDLAAVS